MSARNRNSVCANAGLAMFERWTRAVLGVLVLAGCSAGGGPAGQAPPVTVSSYVGMSQTVAPPVATRDDAAVVAAAVPAEMPGYTKDADQPTVVVRLCPGVVEQLAGGTVRASTLWAGDADRSLYAVAVLDPERAPADRLLATLVPQDCPKRDENGTTYVHDRQPYDRDGWTGFLNTSLATTSSGTRYYESAYLISKGDALVNVVASAPAGAATTFDPSVDEAAARCVDTMVERFAV
jgi:hypothetical protein